MPEKSNIWRDCCDGYLDWVKEHVADGCSLDASDACGDPPLVLAAGGGHLAVVSFLLDEGASIDGGATRSAMGETPLIRAAHNGHVDVVRFLLLKGADPFARDLGGNTALHWAAMRGHVEIVAALLAGAGSAASRLKDARNSEGKTALDLAQPQWSLSWRFVREVLGEKQGDAAATTPARLGLAAALSGSQEDQKDKATVG